MHAVLTIALLLSLAYSACARSHNLENGISLNRRYRVQVSESGRPPHITYDIVRRRDGVPVHRFASSYQLEEGELNDGAWNQSAGAEVAWSADSRYVSIDEDVHRYIGGVLLAEVTSQSERAINVPEQAIIAATKHQWDRYRIRRQRGWISEDRISMMFAGREAKTGTDFYFEIVLRIKAGKASVVSCHDVTKEA